MPSHRDIRLHAEELLNAGKSQREVSRTLGVDRQKLRKWKRHRLENPIVPKDAYGHQVPERLHNVFIGRQKLLAICFAIEQLRGELLSVVQQPYAVDLVFSEIAPLLEALRTKLMHAAPLSACDCEPNDNNCPMCRGLRWVTARSLLGLRRSLSVNLNEHLNSFGALPSENNQQCFSSADSQSSPTETTPRSSMDLSQEHPCTSPQALK